MSDRGTSTVLAAGLAVSAIALLAWRTGDPPAAKRPPRPPRVRAQRPPRPVAKPRSRLVPRVAPAKPGPHDDRDLEELLAALRQLDEQGLEEIPQDLAEDAADMLSSEAGLAFLRSTNREDARRTFDALLLAYVASARPRRAAFPEALDSLAADVLAAVASDPQATDHARALAAVAMGGLGTPRATAAAGEVVAQHGDTPLGEAVAEVLASTAGELGRTKLLDVAGSGEKGAARAARALEDEAGRTPEVAQELLQRVGSESSSERALAAALAIEPLAASDPDLAEELSRAALVRAAANDPHAAGLRALAGRLVPPEPPPELAPPDEEPPVARPGRRR